MLKKLLIICPEFRDEYLGNQPWKQIYEIANRLPDRKIQVAIATEATNKISDPCIDILHLEEKKIRNLKTSSIEKINNFNPDLILWVGNPYSGFYLKNLKIKNIPIILYISTMHMLRTELKNLSFKEIFPSHILQLFTAFFPFKKIIKNLNSLKISQIIVPNNTIKNRLIELDVYPDKIISTPLFFEMKKTNFSNPSIDKNELFTVCYFGPSNSIRGTEILLQSISLLKKRKIPIHLKLLLRENDKSIFNTFYSKSKKLGIENDITIITKVLPHDKLMNEIISCNLIAIPTKFVWNEPPLAILESMQLGLPLVTTNVCGLKELVQNNALTVDPTPHALADIFSKLISDPKLCDEIADKGKQYVQSLANWDDMVDWLIKNLSKILDEYNENQK